MVTNQNLFAIFNTYNAAVRHFYNIVKQNVNVSCQVVIEIVQSSIFVVM